MIVMSPVNQSFHPNFHRKSSISYGTIITIVLLFLSCLTYYLGLVFPLLKTQTRLLSFTLKTENVRLFDSIKLFWNNNEFMLAAIIFVFTIVIPIIKYIELLIRNFWPEKTIKYTKILKALDKWSMLDVFIVAILLLNFKLNSAIMIMSLMPGTTFLAISILLRMACVHTLESPYAKDE